MVKIGNGASQSCDATPAGVSVARRDDVQKFQRILSQQERRWAQQKRLRQLENRQLTLLLKILLHINRTLGRPWRIRWTVQRAVQAAVGGTYRSGAAISARHGIGLATQFLHILVESARSGISSQDFYLYQLYLPDRWRSRTWHFPTFNTSLALLDLIERDGAPDFQFLHNKSCFAVRCKEAELPGPCLFTAFVDGRPDRRIEALPETDLFSKPADQSWGEGGEAWRFDRVQDCFFSVTTDQRFSREALFAYFCDRSKQWPEGVIIQERLRNHATLSPLTNGALSTLRIVTCRTPLGSIDLMPPVIRMPTGRLVVDNFSQGGLAAPIDLGSGIICGPAIKKDKYLGVISIDKHPDSGQAFKDFPIPMWSETLDLARRAHETFPSVHFIGWDIAILQDGPVLIEGNAHLDTDLTVLPHGLTLSDTQFIPYYNYHWAKANFASPSAPPASIAPYF